MTQNDPLPSFDWTLPSRDYRDPALFERERREIFAENWMLFSLVRAACETPGDYVTGTVAGYPVFAIRDDAGQIRAFHNVCRHRGAQLLVEGRLAIAASSSSAPIIAGATRATDA